MTGRRFVALVLSAVFALIAAACGSGEVCTPSADTICSIAGTGIAGLSPENTPATESDLYLPMDTAVGPDGLLYIVDWNNHRIRVMDDEAKLHTVAGSGMLGDGPPGPALESAFNHPTDLVFDDLDRMIVAAWHNSRIKRVDLEAGTIEDIAGTGARAYSGDGGPASVADLDLPGSVALDFTGNLYLLDQANQVIRVIDEEGTVTRFAGQCLVGEAEMASEPFLCPGTGKWTWREEDCDKTCNAGYDGDNGLAIEARFSQPVGQAAEPSGGIVFDDAGNLYIADSGNHRIRKIDTDGIITTVAGNGTAGYAGDGGPAVEAQLNRPVDIEVGSDGTLYIADTYNSCIRAVDPQGTIETVAGQCGTRGFEGDGGPPTAALLNRPYGIEVNDRTLYIADTYNHCIRAIRL